MSLTYLMFCITDVFKFVIILFGGGVLCWAIITLWKLKLKGPESQTTVHSDIPYKQGFDETQSEKEYGKSISSPC